MSSVDSFKAYRAEWNDRILNSGFQDFKKFFAIDTKAYVAGSLEAGTKEMLGLAASMVLRCNDCILYHLDRAVAEGATRPQLYEVFQIALVVGGSVVIPHLRYAFEQLEELLPEQSP
jgi:AhpD family alkylhydroperoxidase